MIRTIPVSTDVFAAIWANRQDDEGSEDVILRRLLGCSKEKKESDVNVFPVTGIGFDDKRNGVDFPRGFEIFRTYKRRTYYAIAEDGYWKRNDTGERFDSLNQLNKSITTTNESVWGGNWKYISNNRSCSIDDMRPR